MGTCKRMQPGAQLLCHCYVSYVPKQALCPYWMGMNANITRIQNTLDDPNPEQHDMDMYMLEIKMQLDVEMSPPAIVQNLNSQGSSSPLGSVNYLRKYYKTNRTQNELHHDQGEWSLSTGHTSSSSRIGMFLKSELRSSVRRTESHAQEPTMRKYRCAQKRL